MSPRVSDWKSHGDTKTMSPSLIQTRLFSLPRTLHIRSLPSWHLTVILSAPSILTATPNTSFEEGKTMLSRLPSFVIFRLPIFSPILACANYNQNSFEKKRIVGLTLPLKNSNLTSLKECSRYISIAYSLSFLSMVFKCFSIIFFLLT